MLAMLCRDARMPRAQDSHMGQQAIGLHFLREIFEVAIEHGKVVTP